MYTSVVSVARAFAQIRNWQSACVGPKMETCRKSESSEPARQFRKESEILCPPPPDRQYFYAIPSQPFESRWRICECTRRKSTLGRNGGGKVFVGVRALLPFGSLPLSSRHFTPSLSLPSPLLPSRRLDKGTFSVGQQGKGGWKEARSDAPIDVSYVGGDECPIFLAPIPLHVLSPLLSTRVCLPSLSLLLSTYRFFLSLYLVPPAAGSAEGIQGEGKAGREIKTWWGV